MLSRSGAGGFTLVELLIGMALLAVLLMLGAPAMTTYMQNSKIANATSAYYSAIQTARTEAIRRNVQTQFVLTDTPVSTADLANNTAPAVGGRNWVVRAASGAGVFQPAIDAKDGAEGSNSSVAPTLVVAGAASAVVFNGTISFNGFGATSPDGSSYAIDISNPAAGLCVTAGGSIRCRRITVSPGGQIAACDPAAAASAGDSRAC